MFNAIAGIATPILNNIFTEKRRQWLWVLFLSGITVLTRLYHLGKSPLWIDEYYSYQVSIQNLDVVLRNSLYESHPPLYYLFLKIATGFGAWRTEWGVRWFSAICGALALMICYYLALTITDRWYALLGWLMMLISPAIMFYSQEARSYIVEMMIASLTMTVVLYLLNKNRESNWLWITWIVLTVVGVYTAYSYFMILIVQAFFLMWIYRTNRRLISALGLIVLSMFPLVPLLLSNLTHDLQKVKSMSLTFYWLAQALLAGDMARYGAYWGSNWLPAILGTLAVLGIIAALTQREIYKWYVVIQVVFPIGIYFLVGVIFFRLQMPAHQSRQFLVLLPSFYMLVVLGLRWWLHYLPAWGRYCIVLIACVTITLASMDGMQRYWQIAKNSGGFAVRILREYVQPGDTIASLQYSLAPAVDFYLGPEHRIYIASQVVGSKIIFDDDPSILIGQTVHNPHYSIADLRVFPRLWVLNNMDANRTARNILIHGCRVAFRQVVLRVEILRLEQCRP